MAEINEVSFNRPIPGMSLTHEVGARPWQNPPQFNTVSEAAEDYIQRMMTPEFSSQLVDVMRMGIPLTTIASTMQQAGVMEGKHNIDVGILILPILIETMMLIGDQNKVNYTSGLENDDIKTTDTMISRALDEAMKNVGEEQLDDIVQEPVETETKEEEPKGLMARRAS